MVSRPIRGLSTLFGQYVSRKRLRNGTLSSKSSTQRMEQGAPISRSFFSFIKQASLLGIVCCSVLFGPVVTNPPHAPNADIPAFCDSQILDNSGDAYSYRFRGNRCEGTYEQPTASVSEDLSIISFSCPSPSLAIASSDPLVTWPKVPDSPVSIRIETLPQIRLRYRLDAAANGSTNQFSWSGDTWRALSIDPTELGIVITGTPKVGASEFPGTLLEARLGTGQNTPQCSAGPVFEIRTAQPLSSVKLCARPLAPDGTVTGNPVCQNPAGPFLPSKSISIRLGVLKSPTNLLQVSLEGNSPGKKLGPPRYFRIKVD
jgi:hypothetical protein